MRQLYHIAIDPGCRVIRVMLAEKGLDCELRTEKVWERREVFLRLNPAGQVPVFIDEDGTSIPGASVIAEYLEEAYPDPSLLGRDPVDRAEVRRLAAWFGEKFHREVTANLVDEKIMKRFLGLGTPNSGAIDRRRWLGGDAFSHADITAAAELSAVDYLGDVPWAEHRGAKDWYARVKSRPSFRAILADHISGARPPKHYADLDF